MADYVYPQQQNKECDPINIPWIWFSKILWQHPGSTNIPIWN